MTSGQPASNGVHPLQSPLELSFHKDLCLTCLTRQGYYSTASATLLAILNEQLLVFCGCMVSFSHTCNPLLPHMSPSTTKLLLSWIHNLSLVLNHIMDVLTRQHQDCHCHDKLGEIPLSVSHKACCLWVSGRLRHQCLLKDLNFLRAFSRLCFLSQQLYLHYSIAKHQTTTLSIMFWSLMYDSNPTRINIIADKMTSHNWFWHIYGTKMFKHQPWISLLWLK